MNKNRDLIYYTSITLLHFISLYNTRANPLFLTFENLILVEKQLYREMKRRLSVFWSRGFAGKTHPLKNACFALFLPLLGLFLPLLALFGVFDFAVKRPSPRVICSIRTTSGETDAKY